MNKYIIKTTVEYMYAPHSGNAVIASPGFFSFPKQEPPKPQKLINIQYLGKILNPVTSSWSGFNEYSSGYNSNILDMSRVKDEILFTLEEAEQCAKALKILNPNTKVQAVLIKSEQIVIDL